MCSCSGKASIQLQRPLVLNEGRAPLTKARSTAKSADIDGDVESRSGRLPFRKDGMIRADAASTVDTAGTDKIKRDVTPRQRSGRTSGFY